MRLSRFFHELRRDYEAELDDLRSDSEGKPVLDRRLAEKRRAFADLLPMIEVAPVMVVPALHRAFDFSAVRRERLAALLATEPDRFISWVEVADQLGIAQWAQPLVDQALAEPGGETFLLTALGLEWLQSGLARGGSAAVRGAAAADDDDDSGEETEDRLDGDDEDGEDSEDSDALGEDFLEQQGFDRRSES